MNTTQREAVNTLYNHCERVCDNAGPGWGRLQREFIELYETALKQERENRAMGRRFTNGRAGYKGSAALAARYFVIKCLLLDPVDPAKGESALAYTKRLASVRRDYQLGAFIRAHAFAELDVPLLNNDALIKAMLVAREIDYAKDIAR